MSLFCNNNNIRYKIMVNNIHVDLNKYIQRNKNKLKLDFNNFLSFDFSKWFNSY